MNFLNLKVPLLKRVRYAVPANWNELTKAQLLRVCRRSLRADARTQHLKLLMAILPQGFWARVRFSLVPAEQIQHWMNHLTSFLFQEPKLTNNVLDSFTHKGQTYIGPADRMKNITFEEFIVCEEIISRYRQTEDPQELIRLTAVLYRRPRQVVERYHEDIREPFYHHHLESDAHDLARLSPKIPYAVSLFYLSFRLMLKDVFPHVFPDRKVQQIEQQGGSWVPLVRVMAPSVIDWKAIEQQKAYNILYDFEKKIEEQEERKANTR